MGTGQHSGLVIRGFRWETILAGPRGIRIGLGPSQRPEAPRFLSEKLSSGCYVLVFLSAVGLPAKGDMPPSLAADLLQFSQSLDNTVGDGTSEWTPGTVSSVCQWTGVQCYPANSSFALNFSNIKISGTLSPAWFDLASFSNMVTLDLSSQQLAGSLPAAWGTSWADQSTRGLQQLDLSRNSLSGTLPAAWSAGLSNMQLLLANNNLTGSIPAEWVSAVNSSCLLSLQLYNNSLAGALPNGSRLARSRLILQPGNDQLCGQLPSSFANAVTWAGATAELQSCGSQATGEALLAWSRSFSNFAQVALIHRFFGWSEATVATPCSWAGISCKQDGLVGLWLRDFGLLGTAFESSWDNLGPWLEELDLDGAQLPYQLPASWGQAWKGVNFISIARAGLVSTLPREWGVDGGFPILKRIWLYNNPNLTGTLPKDWGSGGSLQAPTTDPLLLGFDNTGISGPLPDSWSQQLPGFGGLISSNTGLTGTLPANWSVMTEMNTLTLANNSLSSTLPPQWGMGALPKLERLNLSMNWLTGTFPKWGADNGMAAMTTLDVSSNNLSGPLPASLTGLSNLKTFNAANNSGLCGALATTGNANTPQLKYGLKPCPNITPAAPPPAAAAPLLTAPAPAPEPGGSAGPIAGGMVGGLAALVLAGVAAYLLKRRRQRDRKHLPLANPTLLEMMGGNTSSMMSSDTSGNRALRLLPGLSGDPPAGSWSLRSQKQHRWEIHPGRIVISLLPDGQPHKLGTGAFGTAYKAVLDDVDQVAVKLLPAEQFSRSQLSAFFNEVSSLHDCRHPNVVLMLGAWLGQDQVFMVQELLQTDLRKALNDPGRQEELRWDNRGVKIARDIALGLAYLHQASILHCDIKSGNTLLNAERAKIADAGLSVMMMDESHRSALSMRGTFAWMAPEVIMEEKCSYKADVYSLGVVLWEIATQEHPVRGHNRPLYPHDCSEAASTLIEQCTTPSAADRLTAKEVVQRLEAML